ncbi:hypothetical protein OIU85_007324 [Salix viminalis]|uniref:BZIP domain-containing protein n=1 Tax=Salix viminalis TaxID=40686 RepID=A0A9Q0SNL1_SALVM|nr:hypothetical protein OIU85_007324 [Salix viminalis]
MTAGDEWVQEAMTDDSLVVELLLKLNQPERLPAPRRRRRFPPGRKKGSDSSAHASPSTPFSFSCATSVSGGGDGFDEATTSLPSKSIATSRSKRDGLDTLIRRMTKLTLYTVKLCTLFDMARKGSLVMTKSGGGGSSSSSSSFYGWRVFVAKWVAVKSETPTTKRSRKKKTLVELREEESLLLKERRHLKNKLAALRMTVEKERATNGRLKKMKLDFLSQQRPEILPASVKSEDDISILPQETKVACDNIYSMSPHNVSFPLQEDEGTSSSFLLPDLNLPVEGDSGSGVLS